MSQILAGGGLTAEEKLTLEVYAEIDRVIGIELARLAVHGTVPSCGEGCTACCSQAIPATGPEAHTIARYIQRELAAAEREKLGERLMDWLDWAQREMPTIEGTLPRLLRRSCPLLVGDRCAVYPVRPIICRAHFVDSDPPACSPGADGRPHILASVHAAIAPQSVRFRRRIENSGLDFWQSVQPLPRLLASQRAAPVTSPGAT